MPDSAPPDPPRRQNVVLVGFMGAGKSSIARLVARSLGFECIDTDDLVVENARMPIHRIFQNQGEEAFRDLETAALLSLADREHLIISTGGGIVLREQNRKQLRTIGFTVWLSASVEATYERVRHNTGRPLLRVPDPKATIAEMMDARAPLYRASADLHIDTSQLSMDDIAYGVTESARHAFSR
jgi:shikimate kinase